MKRSSKTMKKDNEPIEIDYSTYAEGMDPELFNDLLNSIQEIIDIESGKIDASAYDIQTIYSK